MIFLKVSLNKNIFRFGKKDKLSPSYMISFEILERIKGAMYKLALPPQLNSAHNVFYVSLL